MVKLESIVWSFYSKKIDKNGRKHAVCNFCKKKYLNHATRMVKHLKICRDCPNNIKNMFLKQRKTGHLNDFLSEKTTNKSDINMDSVSI